MGMKIVLIDFDLILFGANLQKVYLDLILFGNDAPRVGGDAQRVGMLK
jgi:hypothetical protein